MIAARELAGHYRAIRARLRNPPNAVPDKGINLKKPPPTEESKEAEVLIPVTEAVIDFPPDFSPFKRKDLTFSSTLDFSAKEFGLSPKEIRAHTRIQAVLLPRQIAVWIAWKYRLNSLSSMGNYLDMDHTTMIHARNKIDRLIDQDDTLRQRIFSLEDRLLAAFPRTTLPAQCQPHLGSKKTKGNEEVRPLPTVDSGG